VTWAERRNLSGNRRANGWRWAAMRADRRSSPRCKSFYSIEKFERRSYIERRGHNRRKDDRDDSLWHMGSGAPSPRILR
jgi:hypothetical protein